MAAYLTPPHQEKSTTTIAWIYHPPLSLPNWLPDTRRRLLAPHSNYHFLADYYLNQNDAEYVAFWSIAEQNHFEKLLLNLWLSDHHHRPCKVPRRIGLFHRKGERVAPNLTRLDRRCWASLGDLGAARTHWRGDWTTRARLRFWRVGWSKPVLLAHRKP